jgi:multiple sugar transport system substrate-binding protein
MNRQELFNVLTIVERLCQTMHQDLPGSTVDPIWSMTAFLMRRHLQDQIVTITSLADASGVPRASARRRIEEMIAVGLIELQPRSRTGRRHAIVPSRALFARVSEAAARARDVLSGADGGRTPNTPRTINIPYPRAAAEGFHADSEVAILAYEDPVFRAIRRTRWEMEGFLGLRLNLTVLPHTRLREHLIADGVPRHTDLLAVDLPWVGELVELGLLRPVSDLLGQSAIDRGDFYDIAWNAGMYEGQQYGIPIQPTVEMLWYRADILERLNLTPPATLDEVLDVARKVHQPNRGLHGIVWAGARGDQLAQSFLQFLGAAGRPLLSAGGPDDPFDPARLGPMAARVDCPEGREVARYMRELVKYSPPDILSLTWDDVAQRFGFGQAVLCYTWSNRVAMMDTEDLRRVGGRPGFVPHPGAGPAADGRPSGPSPMGGVVLAIPSTVPDERLPLVWRTLERLVSPEIMKYLVVHGSGASARYGVAADRYVAQQGPIIRYVDDMVKNGQIQTWQRPPIPAFEELCLMLGDELHAMLSGKQPAADALANAQRRIDRLLEKG